jgi:hypothetical protein
MVGRPGKYQPRFTAGELDPLMGGNTDIGDYLKGASLMQNVRPFPQGGFGNVWGTIAIGTVPLASGGAQSNVRVRSFTHSRSAAYDFVFRENAIDVYDTQGVQQATIPISLTSAQVAVAKNVQQIDTMVIFHQDLQPQRILRQGSDSAWGVDLAPFVNIPNFDYGGTYTNGVAAVWLIAPFNSSSGNHFTISVNGVASKALTLSGSGSSFNSTDATNILAAINAIPGIASGITATLGSATTPGGYAVPSGQLAIEFSGTGNVGDGWSVSGAFVDNANAAITSAHVVQGVVGGEPIMSASRGWPSCGVFYSGRLLIGGFKSLPNAFLASQSSNYWNLDTRLISAAAPMLVPLDTDGAATILELHKGRTLDIFTDAGEYWFSGTILDRTSPPNIVLATSTGAAPGVPVIENEGATVYAGLAEDDVAAIANEASGATLQEFRFDYSQQNYVSLNMSVRSSSLVFGVVDMAVRRGVKATDMAQLYAIRSDGVAVVTHLLRNEQIQAFTRRITDGNFQAVNCNDRRQLTFIVNRNVNGSLTQFVERQQTGVLLDQSVNFNLGAPGTLVSGLSSLEGATVWAVADNYVQGPFVVANGNITLNFAATAGYVGRWTPPRVRTMPQPRDVGPRTVIRRPCRIHTVRVSVVNTTSIAIGANGETPEDVPLTQFGAPTDTPLLAAPFTGEIVLEGLQGFSTDGIVEITQLAPGLLNVTGVTVEVDL